MKKTNVRLSNKEKEIIRLLDHPEFTVDFFEDWFANPPATVKTDSVAASLQGRVDGFLAAVQRLKDSGVQQKIGRQYLTDRRMADVKAIVEYRCEYWANKPEYGHIEDFEELFDGLFKDQAFIDKVLERVDENLEGSEFCDVDYSYWESIEYALDKTLEETVARAKAE